MSFEQLVHGNWHSTQYALLLFQPELAVVATIVALLFVRLFSADKWLPGALVAVLGTLVALGLAVVQWKYTQYYTEYPGQRVASAEAKLAEVTKMFEEADARAKSSPGNAAAQARLARATSARNDVQHEITAWKSIDVHKEKRGFFSGLLVFDGMTVFFRMFLLLFLLLVIYLTTISGIPDKEDAPDFYVLLLGATLGMMLMTSANHLLMIFMAVEMTSVPSYAMVGFLKGRRQSSEAALKYVVYGAGAAGVMLYGISLLAGLLGTAHLPEMVVQLGQFGQQHQNLGGDAALRTLVVAIVMVLAGLAFKLSIFPFHFWAPDAFEGAAAEVGAFLSVASKGAAFAVVVRVALLLGGQGNVSAGLSQLFVYIGVGLGLIAAASATYGNLAAYAQTNIKRMLAYSTIAHAGYMLMSVAALLVIANTADTPITVMHRQAADCISALLYYLAAYLFMNLGAFAIVALVRNQSYSENIEDYAGLGRQAPVLAVCLALCLCSLIGVPPFGGFVGKVLVFYNVVVASTSHPVMWAVVALGVLNTVFSLFYYVRVMKTMFFGEPLPGARPVSAPFGSEAAHFALLATVPVVLLGTIGIEPILRMTKDVAAQMF